jgi:hypothetical protein
MDIASHASAPSTDRHGGGLGFWLPLILLVGLFLAVNLLTATRQPRLWQDEVLYTDPGVNLATGHGFTSGSWPNQGRHEPFVGNVPGFALVMAAWLKMFGVSLLAARSLNYVLMAAVVLAVTWGCRRAGLIRGTGANLLLATLLFCGYSVTFSYRSARYDVVGMLWCSLLFLEFTIQSRMARRAAMLLTAALLPFTGLQLIPFAAVTSLILLIFCGWRILPELIVVGIGIVVGMAVMLGAFRAEHLLPQFIHSTLKSDAAPASFGSRFGGLRESMGGELPGALLLAGLAAVAMTTSIRRFSAIYTLAIAACAFAVVVPLGMALAGRFQLYYTWMMFVPMSICYAACVDRLAGMPQGRRGLAVAVVFGLIASYGLAARVAKAVLEWKQNDPAPLEQFVQSQVRPADVVFCGYPPYFAARAITPDVMALPYLTAITPAERESISLLIINPADAEKVLHGLGGKWRQVDAYYPAGVKDNSSYPYGPAFYLMIAYRRVS